MNHIDYPVDGSPAELVMSEDRKSFAHYPCLAKESTPRKVTWLWASTTKTPFPSGHACHFCGKIFQEAQPQYEHYL